MGELHRSGLPAVAAELSPDSVEATDDDSEIRIRKKRRKKRSRQRRDPRKAAIKVWIAIGLACAIVLTGGVYLFWYVKNAVERRDRVVAEMQGYINRIAQLESAVGAVRFTGVRIVDLQPETAKRRPDFLPPEIGQAEEQIVLKLHTPSGPPEGWEFTLRDELKNPLKKVVSLPADDAVVLVQIEGVERGMYEIHGKRRSDREVTRYVFALK